MPPACRGAGSQSPWSNAGRSQKLHSANRWPTWRATVSYRARLLATVPDACSSSLADLATVWTKAAAQLVCTRPPAFVTFRRSFTVLSATAPSSSRLRAHPSCWFTHVGRPADRPRTPGRIHSEDHIISQRFSPPSTGCISGGHTSLSLYW